MNIYSIIVIISTIFSGVIGLPISTELGPAIVVKQNKPIIYSPFNEPIKAIPPPVIDNNVIARPIDILTFI